MAEVKNVFPGGNTCHGFYSFYDYIVPPDARLKIVLKGGPGVGKSTLMKQLGQELLAAGHSLEFHWCSSDSDSLDALVLPEQEVAILDGTAPHIVEPRYPGVVDEIVNLGEFWNAGRLREYKTEIMATTALNSQYFALAYSRLREARVIYDEWISYYEPTINHSDVNQVIYELIEQVWQQADRRKNKHRNRSRHLFASAITPQGVVTHLPSLIQPNISVYQVIGNPGTGVDRVLAAVGQTAEYCGLHIQYYHNPFLPAHLEAVIIPSALMAVVDASGWVVDPGQTWLKRPNTTTIDLNTLTISSPDHRLMGNIEDARCRFASCLQAAIDHIRMAKEIHDELESFYVSAMNFARSETCRQQIKQRILQSIAVN
jgi:uncharacterized membrane protein